MKSIQPIGCGQVEGSITDCVSYSHVLVLKTTTTMPITNRHSAAERGGCLQWHLFVCQHDNFLPND